MNSKLSPAGIVTPALCRSGLRAGSVFFRGRKQVIKGYSKGGYRCAHCVESALSAAGIADIKTPPSAGGNPRVASNTVELV